MIQQISGHHNFDDSASEVSPVNVSALRGGQTGVVARLQGNPHDIASLAELGLRKGTVVQVIRQGSTSIVKFNSQRLCMRLGKDVSLMVYPQR